MDDTSGKDAFRQRDAWVFALLGGFFIAFGLLVFVGLFWPHSGTERLVTILSGLVLLLVGGTGLWLAKRQREHAKKS